MRYTKINDWISEFYFYIVKIYNSKLSRKLRIYNNPIIFTPYHWIRDIIRKHESKKLRKLDERGLLTPDVLRSLTYQNLLNLKLYSLEIFKDIATKISEINLSTIQKKEKINVAFYVPLHSLWSCDRLYHLFEEDKRFEPKIIVPKQFLGTKITNEERYQETVNYFKNNGYRTIGVGDTEYRRKKWHDIGNPDIIILLTPYSDYLPKTFDIQHIPLSSLSLYIPYGLSSVGNYEVYDTPGAQLCWKYLAEDLLSKKVISEHSELSGFNVLVTGHPKMDLLIKPEMEYDAKYLWKIHPDYQIQIVKKIIYAPHHSIFNEAIKYSTFHLNHREIYEFAKMHPETSWIVKPHQNLKQASVLNGLFQSEEDYEKYMDLWDALPNARTVRSGTYDDLFLTSDAMIMDCGSFLAEYTTTNKPLIFLRRPEQELNEWGEKLLEGVYSVDGKDITGIYETITNVIINGNDYLAEKRNRLVNDMVNIYNQFEGVDTASEFIYQYLKNEIEKPNNTPIE